ncbi:cell division protein ZapD [Cupriavidus basilensis]
MRQSADRPGSAGWRTSARSSRPWPSSTGPSARPASSLTDNEWLTSIRSRAIIPGGTCEFDLPAYYAWQHRPAEEPPLGHPQVVPARWCRLRIGTDTVLHLLRESGRRAARSSPTGRQLPADAFGRSYQLMQVLLDDSTAGFHPRDDSANKYMLWVRFTQQDGDLRPALGRRRHPFPAQALQFSDSFDFRNNDNRSQMPHLRYGRGLGAGE